MPSKLNDHDFALQCRCIGAARKHGVTKASLAVVLDEGESTVSHFTTGSRRKELTFSQLLELLRHAGEGQPAADTLAPILADVGLVAHAVDDEPVHDHVVMKEAGDVVSAFASSASLAEKERELVELISAAQTKLAQVRAEQTFAVVAK